jgi:diaminopimelate epimerase
MKFTKMQGAGNDFIIVEDKGIECNWTHLASVMADRRLGVGADGLLLLLHSEKADFKMRIFNSDGSEAEACGNGTRCIAKYIVANGLVGNNVSELSLETSSGIRRIKLYRLGGKLVEIQVAMGIPQFGREGITAGKEIIGANSVDIKLLRYTVVLEKKELPLDLVSMGNPHAIFFQSGRVKDFPLSVLGSQVERHYLFPNRTNFEVSRVINRKEIEARVWERGVGETLACGSGACAIAVAAKLHDYVENKVDIKLPGGTLKVEWDGVGEVLLSGPVEIVFRGDWPDENVETS